MIFGVAIDEIQTKIGYFLPLFIACILRVNSDSLTDIRLGSLSSGEREGARDNRSW